MTKKEIQAFFQEIRNGQIQKVKELIDKYPELVNACSTAQPKKDDGQSPLQIAFKTGNFDIAGYLIDNGANVNFMENSTLNEWTTPVLHDCIRAVIFNSYTKPLSRYIK